MKKTLFKDTIIEIKKTFKRFVSIVLIVVLGVGFFCGVKGTSPDMKRNLSEYVKKQNTFDLEIISPLGLTDKDVYALKENKNLINITPSTSFDAIVETKENEVVFKIHTYLEDINKLVLVNGTYPKNKNEVVVEKSFLEKYHYNIGDKIVIKENDNNITIDDNQLTIVGIVKSPLYISKTRGSSKLGTGTIDYFMYINKDTLKAINYTEIFVNVKDTGSDYTYSKDYKKRVENVKREVEAIGKIQSLDRYEEIVEITKNPNVKKEEWYVLNIETNAGYVGYLQDTDRVANIGAVFPVVFFIVAALICLTSMTRMVDEQRGFIGTLKSIGYNGISISYKYLFYAFLATIIGSLIGMLIGFNFLPRVISDIYQMMYDLPTLIPSFNIHYALLGILIALLSTVGSTIYSCVKVLNQNCASLLRPEAPKPGKRVLLERINFIWKRLKFSQKVTVRNIFRYKKRFYMTIIGIAGCTALIVSGFGLKDSISGIIPAQYEDIFKYQFNVTLKTNDKEKIKEIDEKILDYDNIDKTLLINKEAIDIVSIDNNQEITLIVPTTNNINDFVHLSKELTDESITITAKLASLLNIEINDKIKIKNSSDQEIEVVVGNITENYVMHYVYMSKNLYETKFAKECSFNDIYVISDLTKEEEEKISKELLLNTNYISGVTFLEETKIVFDDIMGNMQIIANILVIAAGLLAFVVLYNLANVNISERIRELATIKVLGFYDKEVYKYVTREVSILTFIGISFGLFLGNILTSFIVKTCELDMLAFRVIISYQSYFYAIIITTLFTLIVNVFTYFMLKKIDMIESLKSVE